MLTILTILTLLFACPHVSFSGQLPLPGIASLVSGSTGECDSSQLTLIGKKNTEMGSPESTLFRLGETVQIRLAGTCTRQLDDELAKRSINEAVHLHLDNVAMKDLPVSALLGSLAGQATWEL